MAQVYAAKKGTSFLRQHWLKIIALGAILYVGYRVYGAFRNFGSFFGSLQAPQIPQINFPEFKFPEFKFPDLIIPMQPSTVEQMSQMRNQTPQMGTGLINIPQDFVDQLTQGAREIEQRGLVPFTQPSGKIIYVTPSTREQLEERYYGKKIQINPMQYLPGETDVPKLMQMGLAIDMPTKLGQDTFVNRIIRSIQQTERAQGSPTISTVVTLAGLSRQHPELTASQLADLRARLTGDFPKDFDFGMNTGAGRYAGQRLNPVLAAYEQYRAMYA